MIEAFKPPGNISTSSSAEMGVVSDATKVSPGWLVTPSRGLGGQKKKKKKKKKKNGKKKVKKKIKKKKKEKKKKKKKK